MLDDMLHTDSPVLHRPYNQMAVTISPFSADDSVEELTELLHRAYHPHAVQGMQFRACHQSAEVTRQRISSGECYVAKECGVLIATILYCRALPHSSCEWYQQPGVSSFGQFAVAPERRGRGLGRLLLEWVEAKAKDEGARELAVDFAEGATDLIEYFNRRGYRHVGKVQWEDMTCPSVVLSRNLQAGHWLVL